MGPAPSAGARRIAALRLSALGLAGPASASPTDAVRHLLALQGQDPLAALWAIGRRSGADERAVEAAFARGELVRSWPFRSTLHVVEPRDLTWMLDLTAEREHRAAAGRHRQLGLVPDDFARAADLARDALAPGPLDRRELLDALATGGLDVTGQRGSHLLTRLAQSGIAVLTGRTSWALLATLLPAPRRLERDAALAELARRFLGARGPATDRDLAWWSGLTLTDARAAIAAVDAEFDRLEVDGVTYRVRPGLEEAGRGVLALPGFDEHLLGYADRSAQLAGHPLTRVVPGGNGMFLPTIVVDGLVAGTWRRTIRARGVEIEAIPFGALSATARRGFAAEAERYAAFLGMPLLSVDIAG